MKKYVNLYKEFDPDEGELTRTKKLRRRFLEERYRELIDAIYRDKTEMPIEAQVRYQDGRLGTIKTTISIKAVQGAALMTFFLQLAVTGLATGMVFALIAMGFVVILKCSGVFNIAQGYLVMIGSYLGYTFLVPFPSSHMGCLILAIIVAIILGLLIERLTLRPLFGQPVLAIIMMTIALSSVLEGLATLIWGGQYKTYHVVLPSLTETWPNIFTTGIFDRVPGIRCHGDRFDAFFPLYQDRTGDESYCGR